ncbi:MAG: tRNA (N6-threonylcarbamoyladenosine(37)-N6)-methyltransferase TrmO [Bacillota bacterium]|nr:tRNA (N6-threonylcarbamoyladenosine(37)-N6)-methyltransferase TrmO [Bacillota bacterium]
MDLVQIGIIRSPYDREGLNKAPRQGQKTVLSEIEIFKAYEAGLQGLEIGQEVLVIYWADQADRTILKARSRATGPIKGVFSLRSPSRPNPILITSCTLVDIKANTLTVAGLEALDQSALIDIKTTIKSPKDK